MKRFFILSTALLFMVVSPLCARNAVYDAVVGPSDKADYKTIQDAINAAPANSTKPHRIYIHDGRYDEHVEIPADKPNICLVGSNPARVIIGENTFCGAPDRLFQGRKIRTGTAVEVYGDDFSATNITFVNFWGMEKKAGPQALAMSSQADRMVLTNCRLLSYQDTYLTSTRKPTDRHYLKNCLIEGAVDFIYGSGNVVFDSCVIAINRRSGGYIVAPNHSPVVPWGYVFLNCRIVPRQDSTVVWLGRPWHETPKTVFINTTTEVTIRPTGWFEKMGGLPAIFAEYNTMDGKGKAIDLSARRRSYWKWKDNTQSEKVTGEALNVLNEKQAASYTIPNVLRGGDQWEPEVLAKCLPDPILNLKNGRCRWKSVKGALGYACFVNGQPVAFTTKTTLNGVFSETLVVRSISVSGGFSPIL